MSETRQTWHARLKTTPHSASDWALTAIRSLLPTTAATSALLTAACVQILKHVAALALPTSVDVSLKVLQISAETTWSTATSTPEPTIVD